MEILLASSPGSGIGGQASAGGPNTSSAESLTGAWEQEGGDPASACALWCSIAMGALVQGQPPKQVRASFVCQNDMEIVRGLM